MDGGVRLNCWEELQEQEWVSVVRRGGLTSPDLADEAIGEFHVCLSWLRIRINKYSTYFIVIIIIITLLHITR